MATMMGATPPQDDEGAEQDTSGAFCIELRVAADGSIRVGVEPEAEEAQEEGQEPGGEEEYQSVANIREALKLVKEIVDSRGQMPDSAGDAAAMSAGYGE